MEAWLQGLHPLALGLIRVLLLLILILAIVPVLIWWERRLLSFMQDRLGPNRVGPFGLLQPLADGIKLFLKEDITPKSVDRVIYFLAPAVALFPAFALAGTVPWGPPHGVYGLLTPVSNANIGVLFVLAISSLGVYGVVLAGYASNNKYSLMGGLRASAQLISYELAMGVSVATVVLASGSLRMTDIVIAQEAPLYGVLPAVQGWFIFTPFGFLAALIFLICMVAETNRAPFDLPEAENEIIAGYHTEYSSMKFAVFFMGEYAAMFLFSGIFGTLFLGGYNMLPFNWEYLMLNFPGWALVWDLMGRLNYWIAPMVFIGKCFTGITFYVWLRATLPRLRYDQLMSLGWKSLLPLAVANFIVVMCWIVVTRLYGDAAGWAVAFGGVGLALALFGGILRSRKPADGGEYRRSIRLIDPARESSAAQEAEVTP